MPSNRVAISSIIVPLFLTASTVGTTVREFAYPFIAKRVRINRLNHLVYSRVPLNVLYLIAPHPCTRAQKLLPSLDAWLELRFDGPEDAYAQCYTTAFEFNLQYAATPITLRCVCVCVCVFEGWMPWQEGRIMVKNSRRIVSNRHANSLVEYCSSDSRRVL